MSLTPEREWGVYPRKLAERLLDPDCHHGPADRGLAGTVLNNALDSVEALRAENAELREAGHRVACPNWPHSGIVGCVYCIRFEDALAEVRDSGAGDDRTNAQSAPGCRGTEEPDFTKPTVTDEG